MFWGQCTLGTGERSAQQNEQDCRLMMETCDESAPGFIVVGNWSGMRVLWVVPPAI
jgi:hypothetical protein